MPVLLVTGGTRGIGLAICRAFAKADWSVATCYHKDEESARHASSDLTAVIPNFLLAKCDVSSGEQVGDFVNSVLEKWGRLDCVIHNAGAAWDARIPNVEETQWDNTLGVHLNGAFLLSKACLKPMLSQKSGHLVFISSVVATTGNIGQGSYTAAKAGLFGLARSLAREYGGKNIRVNVVCPGFHKTKIADNLSPEAEEAIRKQHLLGKTSDLNEVTDFMLWLAGTQTISGQVFNLDSRLPGWL